MRETAAVGEKMRHQKIHFGQNALTHPLRTVPAPDATAAGPIVVPTVVDTVVNESGMTEQPAKDVVFIQQHFSYCGRAPRKEG
jgi:hypothetical protein